MEDLYDQVLHEEIQSSYKRMRSARASLPPGLQPHQAKNMQREWKAASKNTEVEFGEEGSGKVEEPKFIEMRNDLHEFDISDTDLYGHARDRAFYNALRKALFECICESVESRRIAKVDATHNWFLKSHPGNQNLMASRPSVSGLNSKDGPRPSVVSDIAGSGAEIKIRQLCKLNAHFSPATSELYSTSPEAPRRSPSRLQRVNQLQGEKTDNPSQFVAGVDISTWPSLASTPVPQDPEDIVTEDQEQEKWQVNHGNTGINAMNRRAIRLEQNAKDQASYCTMGASGEDVEFSELKQRWLLAETYQTKYLSDVDEALSRWSSHRARVEEEIYRRREAIRFAAPLDKIKPSTAHLYSIEDGAYPVPGQSRDDTNIPKIFETRQKCLSPYAKHNYTISQKSSEARGLVCVQSIDEAARLAEALDRMGIASKQSVENALCPILDRPKCLCERNLPLPGAFLSSVNAGESEKKDKKGKKARKKSGRKARRAQ